MSNEEVTLLNLKMPNKRKASLPVTTVYVTSSYNLMLPYLFSQVQLI